MWRDQPDLVRTALSRLVRGEFRRGELDLPDGRVLRWVESGEQSPIVVLVAGAGETSLDWAPVLPAIAADTRVVAYDRAGLGASDPMATLTVEAEIADLVALLTEIGPAVLVGHSWGGLLVQLVAFEHPDRVLGLVLVDPSHEEVLAALPPLGRVAARAMGGGVKLLRRVGLFGRVATAIGRGLAARCTEDAEVRALITDAYVGSYRERHQVAMIGDENRVVDGSSEFVRRLRRERKLPDIPVVALSAGGKGKPPELRERSIRLVGDVTARTARGEQVVVADAGHYIHHDKPAAVIDAVRQVVEAVRADR
ncbi:pimeloyl-ACP methyl ester carboxylesterase [Allocatelliglobosispora scoriae]|uniref:Pimeloyl-ACP methyl ester carboxylesterase n=1 Tax=Allocatelliglobosispora scoriae TaxID=643052 RepID=A0A841BM88_9ACTN|nr:alpha/beta hydrolase [Allocatelliglobosispora scoriae]MBB5868309.1 pimeloyl-ACP methyl ester carboxylesterase [Allocatelliglobosispora scoriae]